MRISDWSSDVCSSDLHQGEAVALLRGDEGEAETGVAGCRLDQASSGLQPAVMLRRLDHRLADAILDRAAGILALELQEQAAGTGIQAAYLDPRRVADAVQNIVKDGAGRSHQRSEERRVGKK